MTINPLGIKDKTMAASPPLFYPPLFRRSPSFRLEGGIPISTETEVIPTSSTERNPNHFRNRSHSNQQCREESQSLQKQKSFQPAVQRGIASSRSCQLRAINEKSPLTGKLFPFLNHGSINNF